MTLEAWTVIAVGVAIAGLFVRMDARIGRLDDHVRGRVSVSPGSTARSIRWSRRS